MILFVCLFPFQFSIFFVDFVEMQEWQLFNKSRLEQIHERELRCSRCGMKMADNLIQEKHQLLNEGFPQIMQEDFKVTAT